jgi:SAM-dependent methyltransferase
LKKRKHNDRHVHAHRGIDVVNTEGPNAEEAEYWSTKGLSWIENEQVQDELLAPVTDLLCDLTGFAPGERVLDIGCGTGAHALAVAERTAPDGEVLALDISEPLLERTKERARAANLPIKTMHADAQVAMFPGTFDVVTSRFGVMFFEDPAAAFANMAKALKPGGRLVFAAWGPVSINPWWRLPTAVASARLGALPPTPNHAPGPMGLADEAYVKAELAKAGLEEASVASRKIDLGTKSNAVKMAALAMKIGPAARVIRLANGTESDRTAIEEALVGAFSAYQDGETFAMPASLNIIKARVS